MFNISDFIKENKFLCIGTFGFAVVGYLGYRAVKWVIEKNFQTEIVDDLAQANLQKPFPPSNPKSLLNRIRNLTQSKKITSGQGEYIVFHQENGEKKEVSRETFEQVYKILNDYSPGQILKRNSPSALEVFDNRFEIIKSKIKEIDPTLEVVFIPRTLYELLFIKKCIKEEDVDSKKLCEHGNPDSQKNENLNERIQNKNCWHLSYFEDEGDNEHAGVKEIAYRLNQIAIKKFNPVPEGFTKKEFQSFATKQIEFFKSYAEKISKLSEEKVESIDNAINATKFPNRPAISFGFNYVKFDSQPMVMNESNEKIVKKAVDLDCSAVARNSFILYRGSVLKNDSCIEKDHPGKEARSLSYGTSLFAGVVYDGGATAFGYMRRKDDNASAFPVPFKELDRSPFYIPSTNTIAQLLGRGEIFHARTKAWKGCDVQQMSGFLGLRKSAERSHLKSELTKEQFIKSFKKYKGKAIRLK